MQRPRFSKSDRLLDLKSQLQAAGHDVVATVITAEEALEVAEAMRPDLVLMDIKLAGDMDGIEAAEQMRLRQIPIVFLTANTDDKTRQRAKRAEPFGYLSKPVGSRELENAIEIALLRSALWLQLSQSEALNRAILEGAHEGILTLDREGRILDLNPAALEIFGFPREQAMGREMVELIFAREGWEHCRRELAEAIEQGIGSPMSRERETTFLRAGSDGFPAEVTLTRIPVDGPARFTAFVRDITERRRKEAEKESLIRELTEALAQVKHLRGLLPVCAWCKKIRDDQGYWQEVDEYLQHNTDITITHGMCPACSTKITARPDDGIPT